VNIELMKKFEPVFQWWFKDPENRKVYRKSDLGWSRECGAVEMPFDWSQPHRITHVVKGDNLAK